MGISMLKIRRPLGRLIFNMGIAIPGKTVFLIETAPWCLWLVGPSIIDSCAYNQNDMKSNLTIILIFVVHSSHKFSQWTAAHCSRHVRMCNLIRLLFFFTWEFMSFCKIWNYKFINNLWNGSHLSKRVHMICCYSKPSHRLKPCGIDA